MTVLATSDIIVGVDNSTKKVLIGLDIFVSRRSGGWGGSSSSVMRLNNKLEVIWDRHLFRRDYQAGSVRTWGEQCALTKNQQYLYVCGASDNYDSNLVKLNADDGTTVWEIAASTTGFQYMVLDADENIYVRGATELFADEVVKKYDSSGNLVWTIAIGVSAILDGIAVDSNGNVYTIKTGVLTKYDSDGNFVDSVDHTPASFDYIAIDPNDNIYIGGDDMIVDATYYQLFKFDTDLNLLAKTQVAEGSYQAYVTAMTIDNHGDVVVACSGNFGILYLEKHNSALDTKFWNQTITIRQLLLTTDVQKRIHMLGTEIILDYYEIRLSSDGTVDRSNIDRFNHLTYSYGIVCSRDIYVAKYTDQSMNYHRDDMCCFLDDTIPEYVDGVGYTGYVVDDVIWCNLLSLEIAHQVTVDQPELITGIFQVVANINDDNVWPGNIWHYRRLTMTPPCGNSNWNTYTGFGGIGASPQFYTITLIDLKNMSDDSPSEYNGEYLIVKGPGIWGFFFRCEHDRLLRINFIIQDSQFRESYGSGTDWLVGDDKEKVHFGFNGDESSIFKYESPGVSTHDEKLTAVANANVKVPTPTPDAIVYGGTMSMYPGRREQWDAITVWAVNDIVAWEGVFYICILESTNNEPPNVTYWSIV